MVRQCRVDDPTTGHGFFADLAPSQVDVAGAAVESTCHWYWLVDGLMDHGYAVRLVNTTAIPQHDG